jgi:secondary thiamine-phosphate synthase enzyme
MITHPSLTIQNHILEFETAGCLEFLDCTDELEALLERSGIRAGFMNIQTKHTTASLLINENEPLLITDIKRVLETLAPQQNTYLHNDFSIRTVNMQDHEDRNGHSHCKAIFLPTSHTLNIVGSRLDLGRWQRIFLLELDQPKIRNISVTILGIP